MFRATYLAHHGWLFESRGARLLVDPLFHDRFGFTDSVELRVHPPRRFDFEAFPPIDAVFLTHEHEGHFDLPSLALLDRSIPLHVSSRSSIAMRQILGEMGFTVHLTSPDERIAVGDLFLHPLTADQVPAAIEEWDVLPYLVADRDGHGSFFTQVDMPATEAMWKAARAIVKRPGLWAHTNNQTSWHFLSDWARADEKSCARLVRRIFDYHAELSSAWETPLGLLVVGGGFSFGGDRRWLNGNVFLRDSQRAAEALALLLPGERVSAPSPGQRFTLERGRWVDLEPQTEYVRAAPPSDWPPRDFRGDVAWVEGYTATCGRTELSEREVEDLARELNGFAAHLYGGALFRRLYSLCGADRKERKPTFALALRDGSDGGAFVFEYVPQACAFVPVECADPASEYLSVLECWASDLLASFRCEISPTALGFARCRSWNANPEAFQFDLVRALFEYTHPLRHPDRYLELYRRAVAHGGVETRIDRRR